TKPKELHVDVELSTGRARIGAMAKGAGMIAPNLATLLAFFTTDATVEAGPLRSALVEALGGSLNRITADGDTSPNDCAIILASGASGTPALAEDGEDFQAFRRALTKVSRRLADLLIRDGEGVTRIAQLVVEGARTTAEAERVARVIAESPLVKTAL